MFFFAKKTQKLKATEPVNTKNSSHTLKHLTPAVFNDSGLTDLQTLT